MNTNRNQSCYSGQRSMSATPYSSNMKNNHPMQNTSQMHNRSCMDTKQYMRDTCCTNDDACHKNDACLSALPIGMAYIPWQSFRDLYDPHMGLDRGTLFKELDYPFMGKRGNY